MPTFSRRSLSRSPLLDSLRRHPFLLFGLPFLTIVVSSSFVLQSFTQTRYDYNATKKQAVTGEERLGMSKDRKRVDIREEYYRLNGLPISESDLDAASLPSSSAPSSSSSRTPLPPMTTTPLEPPSPSSPSSPKTYTNPYIDAPTSPASLITHSTPFHDPLSGAPRPPTKHATSGKRRAFSMAPISQDELENVRVPRPEGVPEWGTVPRDVDADAPLKGYRREDRWV